MTRRRPVPGSLVGRLRQLATRSFSVTVRRLYRLARQLSLRYVYPRAPRLHSFLFLEMRRRAIAVRALLSGRQIRALPTALFGTDLPTAEAYEPRVSVIVPCYDHAAFLERRLRSIAEQTYPNVEVILLDDASTDGSLEILEDFADRHPGTRLHVNAQNSGSPFSQWERGIRMASGDLIWVAESDDFCDPDFLAEMVRPFADGAVMLAFARTEFVDATGTRPVWSMDEYLPDLRAGTWDEPFRISAQQLVETAWSRKNVVPNVSAAVFRRAPDMALLDDVDWRRMRVCGDWLFYLHIANGGLVAYTPSATSYYRQHDDNTSVALHGLEVDLAEHLSVAEYLIAAYRLDREMVGEMHGELRRRWDRHNASAMPAHLADRLEAIDGTRAALSQHRPHLLIVVYSLVPGGGEIMPLRLANLLKRNGDVVSVLDAGQRASEPGVRAILRPDVPLYRLRTLEDVPRIVADLAVDIIHTHHTWVDVTIAELMPRLAEVSLVITSHGMYDDLEPDGLRRHGSVLAPWVEEATYVADKNRAPLLALGIDSDRLTKIPNAIEHGEIHPIERASLGIAADAFVLCIVSRAIREKGWQEAIETVELVRGRADRPVHLLLGGTGPELHRLRTTVDSEGVHFLGFVAEPWNAYAAADLGILPSSYAGESQPLSLIECLAAGRPFLASDIGEIGAMLSTPRGMAGFTVPLVDGKAEPDRFAERVLEYLADPDLYERHRALADEAYRASRPDVMVDAYEAVYQRAWDGAREAWSTGSAVEAPRQAR